MTTSPSTSDPLDVVTLTRLANQILREDGWRSADPVAAPAALQQAPAALPQGVTTSQLPAFPQGALPHAPSFPHAGALPHPAGLPGAASTPGVTGLSASPASPVLVPAASVPPAAMPSAPSAPPGLGGLDLGRLHAPPPGLPDEATLRSLLAPAFPDVPAYRPVAGTPEGVAGHPAPASPSHAAAAPSSFYFLDYVKPPAAVPVARVADPYAGLVPGGSQSSAPFDLHRIRGDFPILDQRVNGRRLVWLDNAATTQKPRQVIDRLKRFYETENSNIHRAAHALAARATDAYEGARQKVQRFLGAASPEEIIFVRGTTEGINLIAQSWARTNLTAGDEVLISWLEHHANIVPWQQVCAQTGAVLRVAPVDDDGQVLLAEYGRLLGPKTKLVSLTQVSNALGTVTPVKQMTAMARAVGAKVMIDGAQAVSHLAVNVQELGCDWYVFSGHKVFGPTGIGVVYGRREVLESMPPWQGGGNMIEDVTFERTRYHGPPARFEAGTGNIADAVGLGAAIDYVTTLGMEAIGQYEHGLLVYATRLMRDVPGVRLIGTAADKASVLSFVLDGYTTVEVGSALDQEGIAVRSGHHCAQPILRRFGLEATVRPSLAFYNTCADVDALVAAVHRLAAKRPKRR